MNLASIPEFVLPASLMLAIASLAWIKWIDTRNLPARRLLLTLVILLVLRYIYWRFTATLPSDGALIEHYYAWAYLVLECVVYSLMLLNLSIFYRMKDRVATSLIATTKEEEDALVDILIPTYNEDPAIVERTLIGARSVEHPRLRIWLLDDGNRCSMSDLAKRLGVEYLARTENDNAKAGNLNHALHRIRSLPETPEFVAVFDADFVPQTDFVRRTLPLFRDPAIGLVQTPQHFYTDGPLQYNFRASSVWPEEQRVPFDVLLPARDAWGTAFCCGTSWIARFDALTQIGFIPTESITEDYLTSVHLAELGWRTAYLDLRLSAGMAPSGVKEYISQRCRWSRGTMQIVRGSRGILTPRRMGCLHRLHLLDHFGYWAVTTSYRVIKLYPPIFYWFTGVFYLHASLEDFLCFFMPMQLSVQFFLIWVSAGRILPVSNDVAQQLVAWDASRAAFAGLFLQPNHRFTVTAKDMQRNQPLVHTNLLRRCLIIMTLIVAGIFLASLPDIGPALDPDTTAIVLLFSLWNLTVLGVTALAQFERPRWRDAERISPTMHTLVRSGESVYAAVIENLSVGGALIRGLPAGLVELTLAVQDVGDVRAAVVFQDENFTALTFELDEHQRQALIRKVHALHRVVMPRHYRLLPVLRVILLRGSELIFSVSRTLAVWLTRPPSRR